MKAKVTERWLLCMIMLIIQCPIRIESYSDSIFDFTSFDNINEWQDVYRDVCSESIVDMYREPRVETQENNLKGSTHVRTPVQINSSLVVRSPDNKTLQIYNNQGIRSAYSVSYGFQRNKECLNGLDSDCVTSPELGRVRAVVVNADRFPKGQDLNYIKDHFLTEEPEKFVTILNGGSKYERKFYEAVFLGGYGPRVVNGEVRSSHEVDGKIYPMEIYMYFIDESVPSLSLATILVVLVEESKKDNPYIKPIISTVKDKLYDEERRFLQNNRYLRRREKLFHHLGPSVIYDLKLKQKQRGNRNKQKQVLMETFDGTANYEKMIVRWQDVYERMQGLDARLRIIDEDKINEQAAYRFLDGANDAFAHHEKVKESKWDYQYKELQLLALSGMLLAFDENGKHPENLHPDKCDNAWISLVVGSSLKGKTHIQYKKDPQGINIEHKQEYFKMAQAVCRLVVDYVLWLEKNSDKKRNKKYATDFKQKYADIKDYQDMMKERDRLDLWVYEHYFVDNTTKGHAGDEADTIPIFSSDENRKSFVSNVLKILTIKRRVEAFKNLHKEIESELDQLAKDEHFDSLTHMRAVLEYLKYEIKSNKLKRDVLHDAYLANFLPFQQKRRGFQEFGNMGMNEEEVLEMKKKSPIKVPVDQSFQISWLMPQFGGYYYYQGSSPVPPCFGAQNVIVFKKPITMSKDQIKVLTRVPISFNRSRDITFNAPFLHDLFYTVDVRKDRFTDFRHEEVVVPVYDQPRNHLFLGHDGVHKNAVEEYEKRKAKNANKKSAGTSQWTIYEQQLQKLIFFLIFIYYNVFYI